MSTAAYVPGGPCRVLRMTDRGTCLMPATVVAYRPATFSTPAVLEFRFDSDHAPGRFSGGSLRDYVLPGDGGQVSIHSSS